jgi:hypothetical protein
LKTDHNWPQTRWNLLIEGYFERKQGLEHSLGIFQQPSASEPKKAES